MDGTLTVPLHDFQQQKQLHNLPQHLPLLEGALQLPEPEQTRVLQAIEAWELDIANRAIPSQDAVSLLSFLHKQQKYFAILTRNLHSLALITLEAADLMHYFSTDFVLGRTCATPKPSPDGIHHILNQWDIPAKEAVMVGDHYLDIEAGLRAGTQTIQILRSEHDLVHPKASATVRSLLDVLKL